MSPCFPDGGIGVIDDGADFAEQVRNLEAGPLPCLRDGRRLTVEEHLAIGGAFDQSGAEQWQALAGQFGVGKVGDA